MNSNLDVSTIDTYNNDIGTFFVASVITGGVGALVDIFIKSFFNNYNSFPLPFIVSSATTGFFIYNSIDSFRLFKTIYKKEKVIVKKVFTHDTRKLNYMINYDKNGLKTDYYQTGDNNFYLSTDKDLFLIEKSFVPTMMHIAEPGKKLFIESWTYATNPVFKIFNAKIV